MSKRDLPASPGRIEYLRRITWWMDQGLRVPGTNFRFGLDPIIGLIPGFGDAAGALIGTAIILEALRSRVAHYTLLRMTGNVAFDAMIGAVPLLGDLVDFGWKANTRNLQLLERHLASPVEAHGSDRRYMILLGTLLGLVAVGVIAGGIFLARLLWHLLLSK
ncbi:MAG TPA: DUF4112 domain-containing protein [Gemmatimonadales bacterium]|nr:DUF4112 domain-containing protein [Gemmatimonadales bacterium]